VVEEASVPSPRVTIGVVEETAREWVAKRMGVRRERVMTATVRTSDIRRQDLCEVVTVPQCGARFFIIFDSERKSILVYLLIHPWNITSDTDTKQ
jgi:hypothetical protein